jgi:iron(II)-dependent oxidoreductase
VGRARAGLALSAALALATLEGAPPGPGAARADGLVRVEAGAFWMGSESGAPDERPLHQVFVSEFWIDRHKVANRAFAAFLNARGLVSPEGEDYFDPDDADARIHRAGGAWAADRGFEDHPAVEVSWFGARDYCLWRGRRLPTEAEWEKAARGEDRRRYPWGPAAPTPERAVYGRAYNATAPADGRPAGASPYGVLDLLGNLREWTSSEYRPYPYRADDGRERAGREASRVVRGASHDDPAGSLRVTARHHHEHRGAARGHHHVGFRCATSADPGGR